MTLGCFSLPVTTDFQTSCLPLAPPKTNKHSKLHYSRFCDLRFSIPGILTYSSLPQPARGKLATRAHVLDQDHGTRSRCVTCLWGLFLPHLMWHWGVMMTDTITAFGPGWRFFQLSPKCQWKKSQNGKPREALENHPVMFLHCINMAMVTMRCQRNGPRSKMLLGQNKTRAKSPDMPSPIIFSWDNAVSTENIQLQSHNVLACLQ